MSSAAERLDRILNEVGLKLNSFGNGIGLTTSQVLYDIKKGKIKSFSSDLTKKITDKYPQFNSEWIMYDEGNMKRSPNSDTKPTPDMSESLKDRMIENLLDQVKKLEEELQQYKAGTPKSKEAS